MFFKKNIKILIIAFFIFATTISTNAMKEQTQIKKNEEDISKNTINKIESNINELKKLNFSDMICSNLLRNVNFLLKYDYDLKNLKEELTKQYNTNKINELKIIINDEIKDQENINKINNLRFTINELGTKILKIYIEKFKERSLKDINSSDLIQEKPYLGKELGELIIIRQRLQQHKLFSKINDEIKILLYTLKELIKNLDSVKIENFETKNK